MDFMEMRFKFFLFVLFAIVATLLILPIASTISMPNDLDFLWHSVAIMKAKAALMGGQFPLRTVPAYHGGLAYPLFQFYCPTSYTIAGWIYEYTGLTNPYVVYLITLWCFLVLGAIYIYRISYGFVKSESAAILASMVYLVMPHHIIIIDHMGAFNEVIALGIVPVVLYYTLQLYTRPTRLLTWLQSAAAWYFLITVHIVTFVATSFFLAMLFIFFTLTHLSFIKNLMYVGIAYLFGCLMAAWYFGPLILLGKYLSANRLFDDIHIFNLFYPTLSDLLSPFARITEGIKLSQDMTNSMSRIHPTIGLPILLAVGVGMLMWFKHQAPVWLKIFLSLFIIVFLLTWSPFNLWQWIPDSFRIIQYSWRLLGQLMWVGPVIFAFVFTWIFNHKLRFRQTLLGSLLIIWSTSSGLFIQEDKMESLPTAHFKPSNTIFDLMKQEEYLLAIAYTIDPNKFKKSIHAADSILIDTLFSNPQLDLQTLKPIMIPFALIKNASHPFISLKGRNNQSHSEQFTVMGNDHVIAHYSLQPGEFNWKIPIHAHQNKPLLMQFKMNPIHPLSSHMPINEIALEGLLDSSKVFTLEDMHSHCEPNSLKTSCEIQIPSSIKLIELPVYYYPDMLDIKVNNQLTGYISVLHKNTLIAAIAPEPGKFNHIEIQFKGLLSANYLSAFFWQLWLILMIYIFLKKYTRSV